MFNCTPMPKTAFADGAQPANEQQYENVLSALHLRGYTILVTTLEIYSVPLFPPNINATIFAPSDAALASVNVASPIAVNILRYHVATMRLSYKDLIRLPMGTMLNTLLPPNRLLVTSVPEGTDIFKIDDVAISNPDIYSDETVMVHGVDHIFNAIIFGLQMPFGRPASPPPPRAPLAPSEAPAASGSDSDQIPSADYDPLPPSILPHLPDVPPITMPDQGGSCVLMPPHPGEQVFDDDTSTNENAAKGENFTAKSGPAYFSVTGAISALFHVRNGDESLRNCSSIASPDQNSAISPAIKGIQASCGSSSRVSKVLQQLLCVAWIIWRTVY